MHRRTSWVTGLIIGLLAFATTASANADVNPNDVIKTIDASFYSITPYDLVYGDDNAPIQVLEYYSLTCPHCSYFYLSIFPSLKKKYIDTGKVKWIKRTYVRDPAAMQGALLLNCVDKSKQENYLKILLNKQSNWANQKEPTEVLGNIASLGGISKQDFQKCMNDRESEHKIKAITIKAIEGADVSGTPAFYVNQEKLMAFSDQAFIDRFNEILTKPIK